MFPVNVSLPLVFFFFFLTTEGKRGRARKKVSVRPSVRPSLCFFLPVLFLIKTSVTYTATQLYSQEREREREKFVGQISVVLQPSWVFSVCFFFLKPSFKKEGRKEGGRV